MLRLTYVHEHDCERKGQQLTVHPPTNDGSAFIVHPVCEETMTELRRVAVDKT